MTKIAILHAYSASNAGDGLLVDAAVDLLDEAFDDCEYTVFARYPESFPARPRVRFVSTRWATRAARAGCRALRSLDDFDLVVGVGGGYLRFGGLVESAKTAIAHLPQLLAAARTTAPTVYLPQSIGPEGAVVRAILRRLLAKVDLVCLRDDRSVAELALDNAGRFPDTALLDSGWSERRGTLSVAKPVVSVRPVRRAGRRRLSRVVSMLRPFDGWVQSTGAGNDDSAAVERSGPDRVLGHEEYTTGGRRVVVAVRLHAALMALRAGHWVVHLAYERKGFGAFADLGLPEHVHSVYGFDPATVQEQVTALVSDAASRARYDRSVMSALAAFRTERQALIGRISSLAGSQQTVDRR